MILTIVFSSDIWIFQSFYCHSIYARNSYQIFIIWYKYTFTKANDQKIFISW